MTSEQNATTAGTRPRTLAEKVWDAHVVVPGENGKPDPVSYTHLTLPTTPYV